jgi:hypothetical protein
MIEIVYRGFDGLDVAFQGALRRDLVERLDAAKIEAQKACRPIRVDYNQVHFLLAETGAPNGYAFRCDTGDDGAIWFFKRGMNHADWNIRVSVKSMTLALYGGGVRARLYDFLAIVVERVGQESIARVDYAVDMLIPGFALAPDNFVMHSHTDRRDHVDPEPVEIGGKSSRVTSVTVGHMPRRQVIVYDKRAEVIQKQKVHWWEIWNAGRRARRLPDLDPKDRDGSRVWRLELRAGKEHLNVKWGIRRWPDLDNKVGDLFHAALKAVRYTEPNGDTNRSRWPNSAIWEAAERELAGDLVEMTSGADPVRVAVVRRDHQCDLLERQILGGISTYSVLAGIADSEVSDLPDTITIMVDRHLREAPDRFEKSRARASQRYSFIEQFDVGREPHQSKNEHCE